ncbi:MAG: hypothetical protein RMX96_27345 [Nostoc sp. ChiSLP02]|nr:hypothetical protein [Nostoc sp. DedSLP05]MDZ8100909.1 hypothetical protein [Nostoc sp. DedSLP01]MDZ8188558.1 hypothetical protein [Nostoc sp. ChiSLP02]
MEIRLNSTLRRSDEQTNCPITLNNNLMIDGIDIPGLTISD